MADFDRESMLDMFVYEMNQLIESLESTVLKAESGFGESDINEIFRVMHTIKGSSAMMMFDAISHTAHAIEDMFFYLREERPADVDSEKIADVVLESMDFIKGEIAKIESGAQPDGVPDSIIENIGVVLKEIKGETGEVEQEHAVVNTNVAIKEIDQREFNELRNVNNHVCIMNIKLIESCEMKNIRAFTNISNMTTDFPHISFEPSDILAEESSKIIEQNGYSMTINTDGDTSAVLESVLKCSYVDNVTFRKVMMGDPIQELANFNRFGVNVTFSDGYGEDSENVIELYKALEDEAVYIILSDIVIEGEKTDDVIVEIYTFLSENELSEKINSIKNITALKTFELENAPKIVQQSPVVVESINEPEMKEQPQQIEVPKAVEAKVADNKAKVTNQVISVGINKLDQLLNLMGELVIAEAMVTQNPELEELELESFYKDARQLHKIINDVQDIVMGMRMVPLSSVFFKMHRIVRDMSKQLNKEIELVVIGEETEVDKNIIEHISDPLMHMIRNSIDHGIESEEERALNGKPKKGTVILEAKNSGADVLIIIKDDGGGLDDKKILAKAKNNGLLKKSETEYSLKEIHQFIFQPGFSTNEVVTNYSGRGVGMDVVMNNLQMVGGSVEVSSTLGLGSEFVMKIPLTLAIIEGMIISLGGAYYTIPIISIRQQFKAKKEMISVDPSGNEMIRTSRGEILNLIRLSEFFGVESDVNDIEEGIIICVENGNKTLCLHVDGLIGERQVVVKSMPKYIKEIRGISGCTLLGNGDISLIIDVAGFFDK